MAKLAVVFFAALAFQAALGGVPRYERHHHEDRDVSRTDKGDKLYGQLEHYLQDFDVYFHKTLPNDRFFFKTLVGQSRELAQYIDLLVDELQGVAYNYKGDVTVVLQQVVQELREVQKTFLQIVDYDFYNVEKLKGHFYTNVKTLVAQIEKLWDLLKSEHEATDRLQVIVQEATLDFVYYLKNIREYFGHLGVIGEKSQKQLVEKICDVTKDLIKYFEKYDNVEQLQLALRQYVLNIEDILAHLQKVQGNDDVEINAIFQQLYQKLRVVYFIANQLVEGEHITSFDHIKIELVKELENIAEFFDRLVQYTRIGTYESFIRDILGDYYYALQLTKYYIKPEYMGLFGREGLWAKQNGYGKHELDHKYGQNLRDLELQYDRIVRDLLKELQIVDVQDATVRQTFLRLVREYAQQLEVIVQKLQQLTFNADVDVYFKDLVQQLKKIIVDLHQIYGGEYRTVSVIVLKNQYYFNIKKFVTVFQKIVDGIKTQGPLYQHIQKVLAEFLTVTTEFHRQIKNISEDSQEQLDIYGDDTRKFGPRQVLVDLPQMDKIVKDLLVVLQQHPVYNQQLLTVQIRRFVQIVKQIGNELQSYEQIGFVQQVIYQLRDIYANLNKLTVYNGFTNGHQLKTELINSIQIVARQIEKLYLVAREETRGDLHYIVKNVVDLFTKGLLDMQQQFQGYGKNYGYGKTVQGYGDDQTYAYKKYDDKPHYGYDNQGYGYGKYERQGLHDDVKHDTVPARRYGVKNLYGGVEGKTVEYLANQIEEIANEIVDELQQLDVVDDRQIRQLLLVQARQLVQVIDNIFDRVQAQYSYGNQRLVQEFLRYLRQVRVQIQQIVSTGAMIPVHQLKIQLAHHFEEIASQLQKLAVVAQSDIQEIQIVKSVLVQYIVYLRNVQYQLKYNVAAYHNDDYPKHYQYVPYGNLSGRLYSGVVHAN